MQVKTSNKRISAAWGTSMSASEEPAGDNLGWRLPHSDIRAGWELFVFAAVLINCMITPLQLAFHSRLVRTQWSFFALANYFCDVVFMVDVYFRLRLFCYEDHSNIISEPDMISLHYLKSWFLLDFVACLPLQILGNVMGSGAESTSSVLNIPKLLRLFRVFSYFR